MFDGSGSVADWVGVFLTVIAITIGIGVAWLVYRSDRETFARERYQSLTDLGREVLDGARAVHNLANSARWQELVGVPVVESDRSVAAARYIEIVTRLETQAETLALTRHLLPRPNLGGLAGATTRRDDLDHAVESLAVEASWLVGVANLAFIVTFDAEPENAGPSTRLAATERVVEESMMNFSHVLLPELGPFAGRPIPSWREPGSPWPGIHQRRVETLMADVVDATATGDGELRALSREHLNTCIERSATASTPLSMATNGHPAGLKR